MVTSLSSKGQIVLPAPLRREDSLRVGDEFEVERVEAGRYLLKKTPGRPARGLVDLLQACPERDWFQRVASESTDSL
jgi:AbrB family looped-hinge helix DNA binding protein